MTTWTKLAREINLDHRAPHSQRRQSYQMIRRLHIRKIANHRDRSEMHRVDSEALSLLMTGMVSWPSLGPRYEH